MSLLSYLKDMARYNRFYEFEELVNNAGFLSLKFDDYITLIAFPDTKTLYFGAFSNSLAMKEVIYNTSLNNLLETYFLIDEWHINTTFNKTEWLYCLESHMEFFHKTNNDPVFNQFYVLITYYIFLYFLLTGNRSLAKKDKLEMVFQTIIQTLSDPLLSHIFEKDFDLKENIHGEAFDYATEVISKLERSCLYEKPLSFKSFFNPIVYKISFSKNQAIDI